MRVLVTGASSRIGQCLATGFSPANRLLLLGRNRARLEEIKDECLRNGALEAKTVEIGIEQLTSGDGWRELVNDVDLIVHASSSISRNRDDQIHADELEKIMAVELVSPLHLFLAAAGSNGRPRTIIFISSFLSKIRSPQRLMYGSLKLLQEECLSSISKAHPNVRVLTVTVGTVIPVHRDSPKAKALADRVVHAYHHGATQITFGRLGQLFVLLFHIQPLAYFCLTAIQRKLRKSAGNA